MFHHFNMQPPADDHHLQDPNNNTMITSPSRQKSPAAAFVAGAGGQDRQEDNESLQKMTKKMIHRDVERQRREESKALYASLRSLLPIEYLKGKRSISDQVHQAATYICHQEGKIRELSCKRDKLVVTKSTSSCFISSSSSCSSLSSSSSSLLSSTINLEMCSDDCVISTVRSCLVGVEVVVVENGLVMSRSSTNIKMGGLSKVFGALTREGFNIVSYISSKVDDKMIHNIKAEVRDGGDIDTAQLQQKLTNSLLMRPPNQTG